MIMTDDKYLSDIAVYVITKKVSHRSEMLLNLNMVYNKVVLITCEDEKVGEPHILIKPFPNPTALLRLAGFNNLKKKADKFLFFPSTINLCNASAKKILKKNIQKDLNANLRVCIITCTPPHGLALLGLYIKEKFQEIKWIIDWQDLWSYDESYLNLTPKLYRKKLIKLEQTLLNTCDLNLTTNYKASEILSCHYGINQNKIRDINHPYDADELNHLSYSSANPPSSLQMKDSISIGFLGTLSKPPKVPGLRVLKAIDDCVEGNLNIKFQIFGDTTKLTKNSVNKMRHNCVIIHKPTSHIECLRKIAKCDFLLITLSDSPNCNVIMHAKLPHYLMLKKPILALVPTESFVGEVIKKSGAGFVISPNTDWGDELQKLLSLFKKGKLTISRNEDYISKFSWDETSKRWIDAINLN